MTDAERTAQRRAGYQGDQEHERSVDEQDEYERNERARLQALQAKAETKRVLEAELKAELSEKAELND